MVALLNGREARAQGDDPFLLSGVIELPDLRPMGFDSGAELGLSGEDQHEKPEGGITSVQKDKVIRFQMVYMLGSQGSFSSHFRTDEGIYDNTVQWIEQFHPSFTDKLERPTPPEHWVPRETLKWAEAQRDERLL